MLTGPRMRPSIPRIGSALTRHFTDRAVGCAIHSRNLFPTAVARAPPPTLNWADLRGADLRDAVTDQDTSLPAGLIVRIEPCLDKRAPGYVIPRLQQQAIRRGSVQVSGSVGRDGFINVVIDAPATVLARVKLWIGRVIMHLQN
jgi:hypothetical protein